MFCKFGMSSFSKNVEGWRGFRLVFFFLQSHKRHNKNVTFFQAAKRWMNGWRMDGWWMDATPECSGEPGRVQTDDTVFSQLRRLLTRHEIGGKRLQNKALVILFSAAFSGLICQTPGFFLHALSFFFFFLFFKKVLSPTPAPLFIWGFAFFPQTKNVVCEYISIRLYRFFW